MSDPVDGTAVVKECDVELFPDVHVVGVTSHTGADSSMAKWLPATMTLVVSADGVPETEVSWEGQCRSARRPWDGQTVPVTVDRANPQKVSIKWSELPTTEEALMLHNERIGREADEIVQEGQDDLEDARKTWRENLAEGFCTQREFEKEMQDLDGPTWREKQPWPPAPRPRSSVEQSLAGSFRWVALPVEAQSRLRAILAKLDCCCLNAFGSGLMSPLMRTLRYLSPFKRVSAVPCVVRPPVSLVVPTKCTVPRPGMRVTVASFFSPLKAEAPPLTVDMTSTISEPPSGFVTANEQVSLPRTLMWKS